MRRAGWAALGAGVAAYAAFQWLGRTFGATPEERALTLPGDDLVQAPRIVTDHAITIDAPPACVWPWLVQVGWHRGGWYTARWVDELLFPANAPSADHIIPGLQRLAVGDFIPDGPPEVECGFVVERLVAQQHLVLHSRSHLPPKWREEHGAWIDWTWTFALDPISTDHTRFHFRCRASMGPWWVAALYWSVLAPADFVMAHQMLHGVRVRAEALERARV